MMPWDGALVVVSIGAVCWIGSIVTDVASALKQMGKRDD